LSGWLGKFITNEVGAFKPDPKPRKSSLKADRIYSYRHLKTGVLRIGRHDRDKPPSRIYAAEIPWCSFSYIPKKEAV
jgi:hypothetical protein